MIMKKLFLFTVLCGLMIACGQPVKAPYTEDIKWEPTDEELYASCAELKGIGEYEIGKTTFAQTLQSKGYKDNHYLNFGSKSNMYNGHWGIDFYAEGISDYKEKDKIHDFIVKNCPDIKQIHPDGLSYKMGDLVLDKFDMLFYKNVLVAIYFEPDSRNEELILNNYVSKYGEGRGDRSYFREDNEPIEDRNKLEVLQMETINKLWENEKVALTYYYNTYFSMGPERDPIGHFTRRYLLYDKANYPVAEKVFKDAVQKYKEQKAKDDKALMDSF